MTLLQSKGLSKNFGGLRAVHDVNFEIPTGQIRALIGPNGAGKTTFVSLLSGRIAPSHGRVVFDGVDITELPAHKRMSLGMAYTFQITSIFPGMTVLQSVVLAARKHIHEKARIAVEVSNVLRRVGLWERRDELAGDLSYGHQRLLEIAMGIVQRPKLLILDEPTQGLTDGEVTGFIDLIQEVSEETTVLLIEHNMRVVMEIADFITVLNFGETLFEGAPEAVRANPAVQRAYLGGRDVEA